MKGKDKYLGSFHNDKDAARAYDNAVIAKSLDRPLNFPVGGHAAAAASPREEGTAPAPLKHLAARNTGSSKYFGVSWSKELEMWMAVVWDAGKRYHLGGFDNEIDAARAVDAFIVKKRLKKELNFPDERTTAVATAEPVIAAAAASKKRMTLRAAPAAVAAAALAATAAATGEYDNGDVRHEATPAAAAAAAAGETSAVSPQRQAVTVTQLYQKPRAGERQARKETEQNRKSSLTGIGHKPSKKRPRTPWQARGEFKGVDHDIVFFENEDQAANAYDARAIALGDNRPSRGKRAAVGVAMKRRRSDTSSGAGE